MARAKPRTLFASTPATAILLAFSRPAAAPNAFSLRDRMAVMAWRDQAGGAIGRAWLERREEGDPPEVGEFLLVSGCGGGSARWGIARGAAGYDVWRTDSNASLGPFPTLAEALARIVPNV